MKVAIYCFSGTGNTKKVTNEFAAALKNEGAVADIFDIETLQNEQVNAEEYDIVGIAYPIYGFNAPNIVLAFAKHIVKLPQAKRAFVLKTSGEPLALNNASSLKLKKLLKKRNLILSNEYHYVMPYNIIFRHSDEMAARMWQAALSVIPIDCRELLRGEDAKQKYPPFSGVATSVLRIQQWGGKFNGRWYKVTDDCVHCNRCIKDCPAHNISLKDGKFRFGKNCLMCMRCSLHCPKNAIKIGLFDGWRVNGEYSFDNAYSLTDGIAELKTPEIIGIDKKHRDFCRKAYDKYFEYCKQKVLAESAKNQTEN